MISAFSVLLMKLTYLKMLENEKKLNSPKWKKKIIKIRT